MEKHRLLRRYLRVLLSFTLIFGVTCARKQSSLHLTSVRAEDLRKASEVVQHISSPEGLNRILHTVPSPDGKRIARVDKLGTGMESILYGIYVSRASGEERIKIAEVVNCFGVAWSPEGSKIAFSEGTIVHIADSDGQTRKIIHTGPGGPYPGACFNLAWSDNGQKLSFVQVENARDENLANPVKITVTLETGSEE